ncbi:hypothetical protein F7725_002642, partial [Dissostichus mawsoni]
MLNLSPACSSEPSFSHFTSNVSLETEQLNSAFSPSTTSTLCGREMNSAASSERRKQQGSEGPGGLDAGAQPAGVLRGVGHLQVLDQQDPPLPVHDVLVAATLRQLLVSSEPAHLGRGFGHLADQLHAVRLCALHAGQVLTEARLLLCGHNTPEHAGGLDGFGVALVLRLIVEHRLVDDEDVLPALRHHLAYVLESSSVQSWMISALLWPSTIISYFFVFLISVPSLNHLTSAFSRDTSHSSVAVASSSTNSTAGSEPPTETHVSELYLWKPPLGNQQFLRVPRQTFDDEVGLRLEVLGGEFDLSGFIELDVPQSQAVDFSFRLQHHLLVPPRNHSTAMPSYDSSHSKVAVSPAQTLLDACDVSVVPVTFDPELSGGLGVGCGEVDASCHVHLAVEDDQDVSRSLFNLTGEGCSCSPFSFQVACRSSSEISVSNLAVSHRAGHGVQSLVRNLSGMIQLAVLQSELTHPALHVDFARLVNISQYKNLSFELPFAGNIVLRDLRLKHGVLLLNHLNAGQSEIGGVKASFHLHAILRHILRLTVLDGLDILLAGHLTADEPGVGLSGVLDGQSVLHADDVDLNLPGLFLQDLTVLLPYRILLFVQLTGSDGGGGRNLALEHRSRSDGLGFLQHDVLKLLDELQRDGFELEPCERFLWWSGTLSSGPQTTAPTFSGGRASSGDGFFGTFFRVTASTESFAGAASTTFAGFFSGVSAISGFIGLASGSRSLGFSSGLVRRRCRSSAGFLSFSSAGFFSGSAASLDGLEKGFSLTLSTSCFITSGFFTTSALSRGFFSSAGLLEAMDISTASS